MTSQSPSDPPSPSRMRRFRRWVLAGAAVGLLAGVAAGALWYWHSQQPAQRFARALAALDAKRLDEVQRELEALEGAAGYEPQEHFLRGALLVQAGKYYPALEEFGHCVENPELRVRALLLSGEALYRTGEYQNAAWLWLQVLQSEPDAVEAHRWLAAAYYDLGLTNDAMVHLIRVAELAPADPRPHRLMGLIQKDGENYKGAVASYRESLGRDPQQPDREDILLELAECQLKLRQYEAAQETLAQCRPSPDRWAAEAECQYGAGRVPEARRLLEQALAEMPAHLPALLLAGTIALEEGNAAAAVDALSRAAVAYPKDYTVRFKLALAYRRLGDNQRADEHAQAAEQIKRLREEFSKLHRKAAAEPDNADVRYRLGVMARQLDRPDLARVWFRAVLGINPRHEEARRQLTGGPPAASPLEGMQPK